MTTTFALELGVDTTDRGRVCALEIGPFESLIEAVNQAQDVQNKCADYILDTRLNASIYDAEDQDLYNRIVGCTLAVYNDEDGTYAEYDLY